MSQTQKIDTPSTFNEIDTPNGILKYLKKNNNNYKFSSRYRYSVLDLVGCKRKSFYKQSGILQEENIHDSTLQSMWSTVRGNLLHQMTYAYNWRELDMEYKVELKNGKIATVAGRLDMYDWKTKTIMDLKTTDMIKWNIKQGNLPKKEHILQLQIYDTIFSNYIPVEGLNLVYADMTDIVTFNIQRKDRREWISQRIQEIEDSIDSKNTPNGEINSFCQFCPYQTRCYNDGNGLVEKPLSIPNNPSHQEKKLRNCDLK